MSRNITEVSQAFEQSILIDAISMEKLINGIVCHLSSQLEIIINYLM
jgi:hypothetical protein